MIKEINKAMIVHLENTQSWDFEASEDGVVITARTTIGTVQATLKIGWDDWFLIVKALKI